MIKIQEALQKKLEAYNKIKIGLTLSVGLLKIKPTESTQLANKVFKDFIEQVDKNLYKAKSRGRNCIE